MTKTVDFTKEIVCSDKTIKVVQVIPVKLKNSNFQHLIVYELSDGTQNYCSVSFNGTPCWGTVAYTDQLTFLNPEPKIIRESYKNIYSDGTVGGYSTFESTRLRASGDAFGAITLQFLEFDDGSRKVRVVED